jgi:hypothetical protein
MRANRYRMRLSARRARALVTALGLLAVGAPATADPTIIVVPPGAVAPPPYAQTLSCWSDVRLYETLRDGYFPYCREKLRYRPGRLECFQIVDQVCTVLLPGSLQPVETRSPLQRQVIACPDGPEPPVCRRLDVR